MPKLEKPKAKLKGKDKPKATLVAKGGHRGASPKSSAKGKAAVAKPSKSLVPVVVKKELAPAAAPPKREATGPGPVQVLKTLGYRPGSFFLSLPLEFSKLDHGLGSTVVAAAKKGGN